HRSRDWFRLLICAARNSVRNCNNSAGSLRRPCSIACGSVYWRTMKMHVLPSVSLLAPDTRFLDGARHRRAVGLLSLIQPHVADNGGVSDDANVRRRHRRAVFALRRTKLEVELVKR